MSFPSVKWTHKPQSEFELELFVSFSVSTADTTLLKRRSEFDWHILSVDNYWSVFRILGWTLDVWKNATVFVLRHDDQKTFEKLLWKIDSCHDDQKTFARWYNDWHESWRPKKSEKVLWLLTGVMMSKKRLKFVMMIDSNPDDHKTFENVR